MDISNSLKGVLHIPQSPRIGATPSESLGLYVLNSCRGSYPSVEMQSVYSTAIADKAGFFNNHGFGIK